MSRIYLLPLGAWLLLSACGYGQAPGIQPYKRPTVSPYLNLGRSRGDAAFNYYGLVRPQINAINAIQQLQTNQTALALKQQELAVSGAEPLPTGHVAGFLTHQKYFLNRGGATVSRAATTPTSGKMTPSKGRTR